MGLTEQVRRRPALGLAIEVALLAAVYLVAALLSPGFGIVSGLLLISVGVVGWLLLARQGEINYLRIPAVFTLAWLLTIGLAQARPLDYQEDRWLPLTWFCFFLTHAMFLVGDRLGARLAGAFTAAAENATGRRRAILDVAERAATPNRLFWLCIGALVMSVAALSANVAVRGYLPAFVMSDNPQAYVDFYTRFHIFTVAGMASCGVAYYLAQRHAAELGRLKVGLLWASIVVLVIVIPTLVVQRGTFIIAAVILSGVVYLSSSRKLRVFVIAMVAIGACYLAGSYLRGLTAAQLEVFFPQGQESSAPASAGPSESSEPSATPGHSSPRPEASAEPTGGGLEPAGGAGFKLPPSVAFLYSYLTVSHDNFDQQVRYTENFTWGIRQLAPFNVILRSDAIEERLDNAEQHLVRPWLNTTNLIGDAYGDFGAVGVGVLSLLWSTAFGVVVQLAKRRPGPFSLSAYGVCLIPVMLCFFTPWLSYFTFWMMGGTIFLMYLFSRTRRPADRVDESVRAET